MPLQKILRISIITEIASALSGVVVDFAFASRLPEPLRDYVESESEAAWSTSDTLLVVSWLPILIGIVAGWIGLWRLWPPGRSIYLCSWLASVVVTAFCGPVVSLAPATVLLEVSTLAAGLTIGLIYFSELRHAFERTKVV